ncbi:MAG: hypothetical protein ABI167_04215, partial [Nitrosospira sp.]
IGFLQYPNNLAFRKSRFLHVNLQAKSCQKVLLLACLLKGEAYAPYDAAWRMKQKKQRSIRAKKTAEACSNPETAIAKRLSRKNKAALTLTPSFLR